MNKIYQKVFVGGKTFANPQLSPLAQVVIAGMDRQSRNEKDLYEQTGSRVYARDDRQQRKGFTLIELLVVVLIIGILAAVALPQYQKAVLRSRYTQMMVLGRALQTSADEYYMANGRYPATWDEVLLKMPGKLSSNGKTWLFDGFSCTLYMGEASIDSFLCQSDDGASADTNIRYRIILQKPYLGKHYCVGTTAKQQEFCKSMGGKNPFDNGAGALHYELP